MRFERDIETPRARPDRLRARRLRGDRGAIIAEAALLTPFFVTLMFGMLEFGGAFRDYLTSSNAATAGARTAAIEGNTDDADYWILKAVYNASTAMPTGQILEIQIFKSAYNSSGPPSSCTAATHCNDYTGSTLTTYLKSTTEPLAFSNTCTSASPDGNWCPNTRNVDIESTPDYIGIYLKVTHPWITGLFGSSITLTQTSVIQLEPQKLTPNG